METALATTNDIQSIISTTENIVEQNKFSLSKAIDAADKILIEIENTTISDSPETKYLDETCKVFLQKASKTATSMSERRKPITQAFDQVRKYFTEMENQLGKSGEKIQIIQAYRNNVATHFEELRKKEEAKRRIEAESNQERIDIRAFFKKAFSDDLIAKLEIAFCDIGKIFDSMLLSNLIIKKDEIKNFDTTYIPSEIRYLHLIHISKEEHDDILKTVSTTEIVKNEVEYTKQVNEKKQYYLDRIDSKKDELIRLAQANEEEKKRIEKETEERKQKEAEERKQALLNFGKQEQIKVEAEKTESSLNNLFEQNYSSPASSAKKTLQIEVLNPSGYGQIFMFWFEKEGKTLTNEKIEKKSIAQMKKFCEDIANKDGEIINSPSLMYKEIITAK